MKTKRYIVPVISGLLLLLAVGCDKLGGFSFNSDYSVDFAVYPDTADNVTLFQKSESCNIDSILSANGITKDTIESVTLKEAIIKTTDGKTLKGIKSVKVIFIPVGLSEILIATLNPIPQDSTQVKLNLENVELGKYMKMKKYILLLKANLQNEETIQLNAKLIYNFKVSSSTTGS